MKKIILIALAFTITVISCGQAVLTRDLRIQKAAPGLYLNGTGAFINFYNSDVILTQSGNTLTMSGGNFSLSGGYSLLMTGSLGSTSSRLTKVWTGALESTAMPSVNGTPLTSTFAATTHNQGQTTIVGLPDSLLARYTKVQSNARYVKLSDSTGISPGSYATGNALKDSLGTFRPLVLKIADTTAMLSKYALKHNSLLTGVVKINTDTAATRSYARSVGGSASLFKTTHLFTVGVTAGAPVNGDSVVTVASMIGMQIDLFRGTTADMHKQDLNITATNVKTGYRYDASTGTITVRPAFATGDRVWIEGIFAGTNSGAWGTISGNIADQTDLQSALGGKEASLGNPPVTGYILSSTSAGVRSWISPGSGGGISYPPAGIPLSTGIAWGTSITNNSANWNTAYGWGNHASAGYLTSQISHADVVVDGDFTSQGIILRGSSAGSYSILTNNSTNWNTAYGWGNHASAGYYVGSSSTIRGLLSSTATGLTYTNSTGVFSLASGYAIPSTTNISNWSTAYGWGNHALAGYATVAQLNDTVSLGEVALLKHMLFNDQTGTSYTLVLTDDAKTVTMTNNSANTLTVPLNSSVAFPVGTQITVVQNGTGQTTIAAPGVTIRSAGSALKLRVQYSSCTLIKKASDTWYMIGDITN